MTKDIQGSSIEEFDTASRSIEQLIRHVESVIKWAEQDDLQLFMQSLRRIEEVVRDTGPIFGRIDEIVLAVGSRHEIEPVWGITKVTSHQLVHALQRELTDTICEAAYGTRNDRRASVRVAAFQFVVDGVPQQGVNYSEINQNCVVDRWDDVRTAVTALPPLNYDALEAAVQRERILTVDSLSNRINVDVFDDKMTIEHNGNRASFDCAPIQWHIACTYARFKGQPVPDELLKSGYPGDWNPAAVRRNKCNVNRKLKRIGLKIRNRSLEEI